MHIVLPEKLEYIGNWCFSETALEQVVIPQTVRCIGYQAFCCGTLRQVTIAEGWGEDIRKCVGEGVVVNIVRGD